MMSSDSQGQWATEQSQVNAHVHRAALVELLKRAKQDVVVLEARLADAQRRVEGLVQAVDAIDASRSSESDVGLREVHWKAAMRRLDYFNVDELAVELNATRAEARRRLRACTDNQIVERLTRGVYHWTGDK